MTNFKEGDMVRMKEKFYNEPEFKNMARGFRKHIAANSKIMFRFRPAYCMIPVSLLELAKMSKPQITGVWFDEYDDKISTKPVDVCDTCVYKLYIEKKSKQQQEWLDAHKKNPVEAAKPIEPKVGMWLERTGASERGLLHGEKYKITYIDEVGDYWVDVNGSDRCCLKSRGKLLPDYKPMRKWTLEEIIEAQAFLGEFLTRDRCRLSYKDYAHSIRGEEILITVDGKRGVAKCCPTDDWNYYIGSMVALSKITGRRLPSWIRSTK